MPTERRTDHPPRELTRRPDGTLVDVDALERWIRARVELARLDPR